MHSLADKKILKKAYKILALSFALFFISAVLFFHERQSSSSTKTNSSFSVQSLGSGFSDDNFRDAGNLQNFPPANQFKTLIYNSTNSNQQKFLQIQTQCHDAYYTVLIFSSSDDYRQNPGSAKYNRAFACQKGQEIEHLVDLTGLNLADGKYYYFAADQGDKGSWYNPR